MQGSEDILRIEGLCFAHAQQPPLFVHWSARIAPGLTLVRGGESTGKSTLLRLIAGDLAARQGTLVVRGHALHAEPDAYRREVFWTHPRSEAFDQSSALDYFAALPARYPRFDNAALPALLQGLGLTEHQHKPLYQLSTGSRRKVWLAAALAANTAVTLLDEPFAALDKASITFVARALNAAASTDSGATRAWVVADYEANADVAFTQVMDLGS